MGHSPLQTVSVSPPHKMAAPVPLKININLPFSPTAPQSSVFWLWTCIQPEEVRLPQSSSSIRGTISRGKFWRENFTQSFDDRLGGKTRRFPKLVHQPDKFSERRFNVAGNERARVVKRPRNSHTYDFHIQINLEIRIFGLFAMALLCYNLPGSVGF